jgi:hypothetical protein
MNTGHERAPVGILHAQRVRNIPYRVNSTSILSVVSLHIDIQAAVKDRILYSKQPAFFSQYDALKNPLIMAEPPGVAL